MFTVPSSATEVRSRARSWREKVVARLQWVRSASPSSLRRTLGGSTVGATVSAGSLGAVVAIGAVTLIPSIDREVVVCCSMLLFLAARSVLVEEGNCRALVRVIARRQAEIVNAKNSLSATLQTIRRECIVDGTYQATSFNRQLSAFITAIDPTIVASSPYRPQHALEHLDPRSIYSSRLFASSDLIVRVSLFLTFGTLTWALYNAAQALPQLGGGGQAAASMADQTATLVKNLIKAASLKFAISAVGLGLSIAMRLWARKQEVRIAAQIGEFSRRTFEHIDEFLRYRAAGSLREPDGRGKSLSDLLQELIIVTKANTEVHREISGVVASLARRSA